ncbi:sulfite exporter TauE/SafE family protein [Paenibacillus spiritus]|uniref:Probable membrane transporter protein n=1 Tax=Paenibacillus spiritus TaxID=2496557 RepID=A0A5J5G8X5_9BACL|nr:sulfite exporter TauE/SafE family protein [Paenibacillus spiritus]KAA9004196.1 sulfite exporter TauE/SafE family protein [Paenibacillus spiritus]
MSVSLGAVLLLFAVLSGLAKAGFGFGAGMLLNPILTLFVPSTTATTLLAPILWFSNFTGASVHRKSIQWGLIARMLPMGIVGTAAGTLMLAYVDERILKTAIGIGAVTMGVLLLWARKRKRTPEVDDPPKHGKTKAVIHQLGATASGFVGATANSGGLPLILIFVRDSSVGKKQFTANIAMLLAVMDTVKVVSYLTLGVLSVRNLLLVLLFVPFIYAGGYVGKRLNEKISEKSFYVVIHAIIFITGILLIF